MCYKQTRHEHRFPVREKNDINTPRTRKYVTHTARNCPEQPMPQPTHQRVAAQSKTVTVSGPRPCRTFAKSNKKGCTRHLVFPQSSRPPKFLPCSNRIERTRTRRADRDILSCTHSLPRHYDLNPGSKFEREEKV